MTIYGLIGYPLSHSRSAEWYSARFAGENITDKKYLPFPLVRLEDLPGLLLSNPDIRGLNVTIPYKEKIIPLLDETDETAKEIGAVNVVKIEYRNEKPYLTGFNTDAEGFRNSMDFTGFRKAMILGTGGASRAVAFTLKNLGIDFIRVSRNPKDHSTVAYPAITREMMNEFTLVINTTPLGMFPSDGSFPPIPYEWITASHFLYDLVYNPTLTAFLKKGSDRGAGTRNGEKMLELQAEASLRIWQRET